MADELAGNALDGVSSLLDSLGLAPTQTRDGVEQTLMNLLGNKGIHAEVAGIRYGEVTLEATAVNAVFLRYETEWLAEELRAAGFEDITQVKVRVKRS